MKATCLIILCKVVFMSDTLKPYPSDFTFTLTITIALLSQIYNKHADE